MDGSRSLDEMGIVEHPEILTEDYLPEKMRLRTAQLLEISNGIQPLASGRRPFHSWLYGPGGSGKTASARLAVEKFAEANRIDQVRVDCLRARTFYSCVESILTELRALITEERNTHHKLEYLLKRLKKKPAVIILTDADQLPLPERNALLYNLSREATVALVCTATDLGGYIDLHPKVKDVFYPRTVGFEAYSETEILEILKARAAASLRKEAWSLKTLEGIAQRADGNARFAIQTLRSAANMAEQEGSRFLDERHVEAGDLSTGKLKKLHVLKALSDHHKLLYSLVEEKGPIYSDHLWKLVNPECRRIGLTKVERRTFNHHLRRMGDLRVLELKRTGLRGGVYLVSITNTEKKTSRPRPRATPCRGRGDRSRAAHY